jgi:hypothetical protein
MDVILFQMINYQTLKELIIHCFLPTKHFDRIVIKFLKEKATGL